MDYRIEKDTLGEVKIPLGKYYGSQTARSLHFFAIGDEIIPREVIHNIALVKKACASVNKECGVLSPLKANLISMAAEEIIAGKWDDNFSTSVWQTGSGTQANMNVNEVIASRANELGKEGKDNTGPIHPNDDVNKSQSSNDVFPTAMHLATIEALHESLIPALTELRDCLTEKSKEFKKIIKVGRTHLMDAVPITLGQEFSGYAQQMTNGLERIFAALPRLYEIAIGATAVGTGLNAPADFGKKVAKKIASLKNKPYLTARNKFEALASHDALVEMSGALRTLAVSLMKIANDIRWLASGPRTGLGEILLPENEPGSSIMPGKINPTQCEALMMVCAQVMGNDTTVAIAGAAGNLELNTFKPVIIYNVLQAITLLADSSKSFTIHCLKGVRPQLERIKMHLNNTLMLVTALTPHIGYDKSGQAALKALRENKTLKAAVLELGFLSAQECDIILNPESMI